FASITALEKDSPQKNMRINHLGLPKDRRLQSSNSRLLIAVSQIDSSAQQVSLRISRLNYDDAMQFRQSLVISTSLIEIASFREKILGCGTRCIIAFVTTRSIKQFIAIQHISHSQANASSGL